MPDFTTTEPDVTDTDVVPPADSAWVETLPEVTVASTMLLLHMLLTET